MTAGRSLVLFEPHKRTEPDSLGFIQEAQHLKELPRAEKASQLPPNPV